MKTFTLKSCPSTEDLVGILRREFSNQYAYQLFGIGKEKSIIVKQSTFVGAQISKIENDITVGSVPPSIPTSLIYGLDTLVTGGAVMKAIFHTPWVKLERDIIAFLRQKYN